jgi:glutathione S-transferase
MIRLYEVPWSTNVERVLLACGHKGIPLQHVVVPNDDRSQVRAASGQDLVPVIEHDGNVVHDSPRILEYLEERFPDPPLYPHDPARRAELRAFIDWFNRVWKRPPNVIAAELDGGSPDADRVATLGVEMKASLDLFADLLRGRPFLWGSTLSAADCIAYPFLKYAVARDPADRETFHLVLEEHLPLGPAHGPIRDWIERVGALPRS